MRLATICLAGLALVPAPGRAQTRASPASPVFVTTPTESSIKFYVKASVALVGKFDRWNAALTFQSADVRTGVLDIEIEAATVDTGSGMKNNKLKSADFFDVKQNPLITFRSTKVVQTGPETFDVAGNFSVRGVSKPETLKMTISGKGTGSGAIKGTMVFNRKDYGMTSGIPFVKIADHVEVNVDLKVKQVSGPRLVYQQ